MQETIMGYERYPRGTNPQGDDYGRTDPQDYGRDYGSGRDYSYSSARDYQAAGRFGDGDRSGYGSRDYGNRRYGQYDQPRGNAGGRDSYGGRGGSDYRDDQNRGGGYGERSRYGADAGRDQQREYHGSYGAGSRRFEDFGRTAHADDDNYRDNRDRQQPYGRSQQQGYGRQPQGYDYEDRGFFARAGDEVRSWFGDEDAERRREYDSRMDDRYDTDRDNDYHSWRRGQIQSLDRDYDEYRRENRSKFENEFGAWRSTRQTQRDALNAVEEHMDVVGSDGEHVGTVDKVRGDRILLTKNDADAGGRHHSIPSSWLQTVDGKVTLSKSAADAKKAWRDEERNQAMFGDDSDDRSRSSQAYSQSSSSATGSQSTASGTANDGKTLNKSFSGTY
ncbi:DUF2171 domain-containing protein [Sphingomonas sp. UBA978]|nr:DUF2171 domain-containing protein [Sphingomonas sp. UBA978]